MRAINVMPTARWWEWLGGWVKLSLRQGESMTWTTGGPTEEGFYHEATTWRYDADGFVYGTFAYSGRDCDGPRQGGNTARVHVLGMNKAERGEDDPAEVNRTRWDQVRGEAWQRDVFAESMGY